MLQGVGSRVWDAPPLTPESELATGRGVGRLGEGEREKGRKREEAGGKELTPPKPGRGCGLSLRALRLALVGSGSSPRWAAAPIVGRMRKHPLKEDAEASR